MARRTLAALEREIAALRAQVARSSTAAPAARTFATKAERAAGDGFPCLVNPACSRTDLRTAKSGESHDPKAPHWHTPKA